MPHHLHSQPTKTYASGFQALKGVDLDIGRGEIFALLGHRHRGRPRHRAGLPGGAGLVGLVPQELSTDAFESVWATCRFSWGLFGKAPDPAHLKKVLRQLSLWDKRDSKIMALSGGMKRRVLIAKAVAHEPRILFVDYH